ncbi:probable pectinesterase/pectinesterase inhibitor 12 [Quercus robur]|uniref:probable pectinesterase/pectinesterase inhibitor 12 n=1 Tax=Quercus robur TaxID=38942 RepID=UPI00216309A2|nr:probable pectinesterase/pectinesterase inhibitor 12 [Quercus robur]
MASSTNNILKLLLLLPALSLSRTWALDSSQSSSSCHSSSSSSSSFCKTTPYPEVCLDALEHNIHEISTATSPNNTAYYFHYTLKTATNESRKLSTLLSKAGILNNIIEKQRGTIQDCTELHQITLSSLQRSVSQTNDAPINKRKLADARAYLSAALTNKITCLESLDSASGPLKPALLNFIHDTYKHVSNSLSILSSQFPQNISQHSQNNRRLVDVGVPTWISKKLESRTRMLESESKVLLTVAAGGTGNFTTITDAINFAPNNSIVKTEIYVKQGVYEENVVIPSYKLNIFLRGDGTDATIITGNRSVVDGWTTFNSATLAVSGEGFLARDIRIENKVGEEKHQAVALRVNEDFVALYKCSIIGYEDTLYVHSFRQFYRECEIKGTIDFIFGNAAVVFQSCDIVSRMPISGQFTVITAQSRNSPDESTGISFQNCKILAEKDLSSSVKSYLGRPWRMYSRTVYLLSYIDNFIDPVGWTQWSNDDNQGLDTLYYGEYANTGPGSSIDDRVTWSGHHIMNLIDTLNFTVYQFISGVDWLENSPIPCEFWVN